MEQALAHGTKIINLSLGGGYEPKFEILLKRLHVGGGSTGQAAADRRYDATIRQQGIQPRRGGPADIVLWQDRPWQEDDEQVVPVRQPCPALWMTPVIRWDGQLTVCCADLQGRMALGSLARHGFRALWQGERATALRLAHIQGDLSQLPVCAHCGGINWYQTPPAVVHDTLTRAGRGDLWPAYRRRVGLDQLERTGLSR